MHLVVKPIPVKVLACYEVIVLRKLRHLLLRAYFFLDALVKSCKFHPYFHTAVPGTNYLVSKLLQAGLYYTRKFFCYPSSVNVQDDDRAGLPREFNFIAYNQNQYTKAVFFSNPGYLPGEMVPYKTDDIAFR